jgi:protein-disulfide isomerase
VWKDFPLPSHAEAFAAAEAAQCAGSQGRFWEFHDKLFARQAELGPALYQSLGVELGLSAEPFDRCRSQHTFKSLIEHNLAEGAAIGVDSTPFLVVGNKVYRGTFTADELQAFLQ